MAKYQPPSPAELGLAARSLVAGNLISMYQIPPQEAPKVFLPLLLTDLKNTFTEEELADLICFAIRGKHTTLTTTKITKFGFAGSTSMALGDHEFETPVFTECWLWSSMDFLSMLNMALVLCNQLELADDNAARIRVAGITRCHIIAQAEAKKRLAATRAARMASSGFRMGWNR